MVYAYDGTWDGLMCLLHKTAEDGTVPDEILRKSETQEILFDRIAVSTDHILAQATDSVLRKRFSARFLSDVWFALLSELKGVDLALWHYMAQVWRFGKRAENDLAAPHTHTVRKAALRTGMEYNKFLGIVRFEDVGGVFYARMEPDCDILTLLAEHFKARLTDQAWVIHDLRRGKAAVYDKSNWFVTEMTLSQAPQVTEEEEWIQELWKEFYKSTTTLERLNPKVQRTFLPKKYWKHLIEEPRLASRSR